MDRYVGDQPRHTKTFLYHLPNRTEWYPTISHIWKEFPLKNMENQFGFSWKYWSLNQIPNNTTVSVRSTASIWIKDICIFNREKKVFCGTFRRKLYGFGENWKDPTKKNLHEIDFVFSIFQKKISIHILIQLFIILRAFSLYVEF